MNNISNKQKYISYVLKLIVAISAFTGTTLSYLAGRKTFMGGSRVFMYFTTQSNIAIAIICLIGLVLFLKNKEISKLWYIIKFVGTVSITLTGFVFCFVLAPTFGESAWNIQNVLTHVVVPIVSIIDFFVVSSAKSIEKINVLFVTIPPILYAIYAGIGYVKGWQFAEGYNYPYFFLNWGSKAGAFGFVNELPFMGSAWWMLVLMVFLIVVGLCYLVIVDVITKRINRR
ncbi:MAG: hypothetical protein E7271_10335 [Lachnospiraceae bacterium]|jgi:hypothetical protein|nr:hypothetical protein [Lachnospiraceae bacterium]